jgi:hypothetical protein
MFANSAGSSMIAVALGYGGRTTCESCKSIDVRCWHREGRLRSGQYFSWSWTCGGEPSGNINVRSEANAVILSAREAAETPSGSPLNSECQSPGTACHLGGPYCLICECYPDSTVGADDPTSTDRMSLMAVEARSTGGAVGGSGPL